MSHDIEPLQADLWFERIALIASGRFGSLDKCLRHAAHLVQLAPAVLRVAVGYPPSESKLEALLQAEDFDDAARHLVRPGSLSVQARAGQLAEARIACPILDCEIKGVGDTVATAILDAWTTHLLALRTECEAGLLNPGSRAPRKSRSEQDRQWH